jgi:hypothetical protein
VLQGEQELAESQEERDLELERLAREHRAAVREVEEVRGQQAATLQKLELLQEELEVLHAAKSALHAQVHLPPLSFLSLHLIHYYTLLHTLYTLFYTNYSLQYSFT